MLSFRESMFRDENCGVDSAAPAPVGAGTTPEDTPMFARNVIVSTLACALFAAVGAMDASAAPAKAMTPQQMKMGQCNKDATGKTGDERKMFMKTCLGANSTMATKPTQQEKMKTCNADAKAKSMKGDSRKAYMKTCLSNDAAPAM